MTKELSFAEMENMEGGFCNTLAYWEAIADAHNGMTSNGPDAWGGNTWSSLDRYQAWEQYYSLFNSLWVVCFN